MKILLVAGARPNYMKIAPLVHELQKRGRGVQWRLVDTGQHYDYELSKIFFEQFALPKPHHFLNVGSASHAVQTAKIMVEFEKVCRQEDPGLVVVVGDVNSTLACSITARKMGIRIAHVEAGLRSFDRSMPEEINRIVTDSISDYLFVSERSGLVNLSREGFVVSDELMGRRGDMETRRVSSISESPSHPVTQSIDRSNSKVFFVGNIMIDTLFFCLDKLKKNTKAGSSSLKPINPSTHQLINNSSKYAVLTLHRPANVDVKETFLDIMRAIAQISKDMPVFFPCHPRTAKNIGTFKLKSWLKKTGIQPLPPLSYLDFLALWKDAALVLTDSGGIQEETPVVGVPCFTIRDTTERPVTVSQGTNILVGASGAGILKTYGEFGKGKIKNGTIPELWDGHTAGRIVSRLLADRGF